MISGYAEIFEIRFEIVHNKEIFVINTDALKI
jgi:hypothetical protein